ncbi:Lrp/AsnC family transcriptional regulator [Alcaligenaceae bacterium]|nr:Lrp/AsnC family transcriptional regulator [Alcaligenaceae bacterium]
MPTISLDELDLRILEQLQSDSSLTNLDLAEKVHASPPTCLRRVRRLIKTGIIQKQVAILNPTMLGNGLTAIIEITLDRQSAGHIDSFQAKANTESAILQCYRVSPGPDFILIAQLPDMAAYHAMAHRVFTSDVNVRNVRSFFSIQRSKFDTRIDLPRQSNLR